VTVDPQETAREWAQQLPRDFARQLAAALRDGGDDLQALRSHAALPESVAAVRIAFALTKQGDGPYTSGLLAGRLDMLDEQSTVAPVWTGPESDRGHARLTLAVVADLIEEACREIVLASYATVPSVNIRQSLNAAAARGVAIILLLERHADNPSFNAHGEPFPGLEARRLAWPLDARPPGASMHGKVLVIDRRTALVGSANLTGHALERNLECGLLVRGGSVPGLLVDHLLTARGLQEV
jgi:cardiolipin synthase